MQTGISGILGIPECPVVSSSFIYQGFRSTILSSFRFVSFFFSFFRFRSIRFMFGKRKKRREEKRKGKEMTGREERKKEMIWKRRNIVTRMQILEFSFKSEGYFDRKNLALFRIEIRGKKGVRC